MTSPSPPRERVSVLLSTYNGEAFLERQLQSLYAQTWPTLRILVRDDGSCDGTREILAREQAKGRLHAEFGANVGARDSFFALLSAARDADIVLLCDQDDVWYEDKVARAVCALREVPTTTPALYCARVDIVDGGLRRIGRSPLWPRPPSFGNALVENIAMGCTIALNAAALELLRSAPWPRAAIMHDWWCYLVVAAFGRVVYDPRPVLAYRVHGGNTVGLARGPLGRVMARLRRELRSPLVPQIVAQARELRERHAGAMVGEHREMIDKITESEAWCGRIRWVSDRRIERQRSADELTMKALVISQGFR